jgi:hypothetical protein
MLRLVGVGVGPRGLKVRRPRSARPHARHLAKDVRCAIFAKYLWIIVKVLRDVITSEKHVIFVN